MKFLIDENLPIEITELLDEQGHDAVHALHRFKPGRSDKVLYKTAQKERRVILTCDLDFSDIRRFPPGKHQGIIVMRLQVQSTLRFLQVLRGFLETVTLADCAKAITIVEESGYRIRTSNVIE